MSYQVQILLPSDTDASAEYVHEILTDFYDEADDVTIELKGNSVTVTIE